MTQKNNNRRGGGNHNVEGCSFCGAKRADVEILFQGMDGANICNKCIENGHRILLDNEMVAENRPQKRDGGELSEAEIRWFIEKYVQGEIPDYQASALCMAIWFRGMSAAETAALTFAIRDSGERMKAPVTGALRVDKHSTGGVGDKTTLIVAPLVAACGVPVAKMSGRGLGFTGGTVDSFGDHRIAMSAAIASTVRRSCPTQPSCGWSCPARYRYIVGFMNNSNNVARCGFSPFSTRRRFPSKFGSLTDTTSR